MVSPEPLTTLGLGPVSSPAGCERFYCLCNTLYGCCWSLLLKHSPRTAFPNSFSWSPRTNPCSSREPLSVRPRAPDRHVLWSNWHWTLHISVHGTQIGSHAVGRSPNTTLQLSPETHWLGPNVPSIPTARRPRSGRLPCTQLLGAGQSSCLFTSCWFSCSELHSLSPSLSCFLFFSRSLSLPFLSPYSPLSLSDSNTFPVGFVFLFLSNVLSLSISLSVSQTHTLTVITGGGSGERWVTPVVSAHLNTVLSPGGPLPVTGASFCQWACFLFIMCSWPTVGSRCCSDPPDFYSVPALHWLPSRAHGSTRAGRLTELGGTGPYNISGSYGSFSGEGESLSSQIQKVQPEVQVPPSLDDSCWYIFCSPQCVSVKRAFLWYLRIFVEAQSWQVLDLLIRHPPSKLIRVRVRVSLKRVAHLAGSVWHSRPRSTKEGRGQERG